MIYIWYLAARYFRLKLIRKIWTSSLPIRACHHERIFSKQFYTLSVLFCRLYVQKWQFLFKNLDHLFMTGFKNLPVLQLKQLKNDNKYAFFQNSLINCPKMETHEPNGVFSRIDFWGVSRGFWSPFLDLGARGPIFCHLKRALLSKKTKWYQNYTIYKSLCPIPCSFASCLGILPLCTEQYPDIKNQISDCTAATFEFYNRKQLFMQIVF